MSRNQNLKNIIHRNQYVGSCVRLPSAPPFMGNIFDILAMKFKPDYKIFSYKRIPFFGEDEAGPRVRKSIRIFVGIFGLIVWAHIMFIR